ncbi:RIP metalloprotease RseP [bacterium]|nr:RIP metalloprotease RseP [bacterium]
MQVVTVILYGVFALGLLVFVHELGHFLVAKWAGIRVLKFSLGFGQKLVGFKHGDTEYLISALPLGGYVKMAGENPKESEENQGIEPGDYFSRPWYIRVLVLLAGPFMNLFAAIFILGLLYWIGFMVPMAHPQIIQMADASPAIAAGLQPGDVITHLNGESTENWEIFSDRINTLGKEQAGKALTLTCIRDGESMSKAITPAYNEEVKRWQLGITIAPTGTNILERVFVGTPAELAGFEIGDKVLAVEDETVWTKYDFQQLVWPRADQETRIRVERAGEVVDLKVKPMAQQLPEEGKVGVIGVGFKISDKTQRMQYGFFKSAQLGVVQTYTISKMILNALGQMISGQISAKDSLGGPITIMRMAGQEAKSGAKDFFFFLAGISVMLAIINLLPIPVLDGGNIMFFIIEGIMRKPLSFKIQEVSQQIGFFLLMGVMVFATFNDIYKIIAPVFTGGGTP